MARKTKQADYAYWKVRAAANLANRLDVKPGIIPERLWRRLYIRGLSPQKAADQAAVSAYNTRSPANWLKRRSPSRGLTEHDEHRGSGNGDRSS
jgi:hypothetical protein